MLTKQTTIFISRKPSNNLTIPSLPCPTHKEHNLSHLCLSLQCQQHIGFCQQCLQDNSTHLERHKDYITTWQEFIEYCKKMSVTGRLGDVPSSSKEAINFVLQTHIHQTQYKQHMRQQETQFFNDFDSLIQQFTQNINKIKQELQNQFKSYQQDLNHFSTQIEQAVQELYHNQEEAKEYNNNYDLFLKEIFTLDAYQEQKQGTYAYSLRRLMHNIIPVVSKATNSQAQKLQFDPDQQPFSLSNTFIASLKHSNKGTTIMNTVQDYQDFLLQRPSYKNFGQGQQIYNQCKEELDKIFYTLKNNIKQFIDPYYKPSTHTNNKENLATSTKVVRTACSPLRSSRMQGQFSICQKQKRQNSLTSEKIQKVIRTYDQLKSQNVNYDAYNTECIETEHLMSQIQHFKTIDTKHKGGINCLLKLDDDYILTGSNDKSVKIWRNRSYDFVKEVQFKSDVTSLCQIGQMIGVGLYRKICVLSQDFSIEKHLNETIHQGQINGMIGCQDNISLISFAQSDNKIVQWNINDQQQIKRYFDHKDQISCMVQLMDKKYMATGSKDRSIKIFKLVYFEKDFKQGILDKLQLTMNIGDAHSTEITCLGYSQSILFSMCSTGEFKLWDLKSGECLKQIKSFNGCGFKMIYLQCSNLEQSKQGRRLSQSKKRCKMNEIQQSQLRSGQLITVSFDGTIKLFNCNQLLSDNSQLNAISSCKLKSQFDCAPFGGFLGIKDSVSEHIEIVTSGNKNDKGVQIYSMRQ